MDMEAKNVQEQVIQVINDNIENPGVEVHLDTKLQADLGLDSLAILMVINALEDEFGIELEEDKFMGIETVSQMIDFMLETHPELAS
jgi:acyl carrier protein